MPVPTLHLYTHEYFPKLGGITTYCHEFAEASVKHSLDTLLHCPKTAATNIGRYQTHPCRHSGSHNLPSLLHTRRLLINHFKQHPQAYHLLAEPGPILALGMLTNSQQLPKRIYVTLHGSEIRRWARNPFSKPLAKRAMRFAHRIVCVSNPVREDAQHLYPLYSHKIATVCNALPDEHRAKSAPRGRESSQDTLAVLSVGRIHPRKGFDQIIQAIGSLPETDRQSIYYTIAGAEKDAGYLEHLRRLALKQKVNLEFRLNLPHSELEECYRQADLFALTSVPYRCSVEGFGLVYLEAGAHDLPCIAYDVGGVRDAVRDGETGLLLPCGDIAALSEAILFLLNSPDERLRLGSNNFKHATERTWEDVVSETLQLDR